MEETTKTLIYPDAEFLALASAFAAWYDSFDVLPLAQEAKAPLPVKDEPTIFTSSTGLYTIKLFNELKDSFGHVINTDFRVSSSTGIIEASFARLLSESCYNDKYVFMLSIWCRMKFDNFKTEPDQACDDATMEFLKSKYPDITLDQVIPGLVAALWRAPTLANQERIQNLLKKYYYIKTNQDETK
jgi:hypothetical protein